MLIQNTNLTRSIELDECLVKFKSDLIADQQTRLQDKFEVEIKIHILKILIYLM